MSIVGDICKGCEYLYRKGAKDAAFSGDRGEIESVCDRNDSYTTLQFLDGKLCINNNQFKLYIDEVIVMLGKIKAAELRNFMRLAVGSNFVKMNICSIFDFYYRKGLRDGLKSDKAACKRFFENVNLGSVHDHLLGKGKFSPNEYMDMVKYHINKIHTTRKEAEIKSTMSQLSTMFAEEMIEKRKR